MSQHVNFQVFNFLLHKEIIQYTYECGLRLKDQSEWILSELASSSVLTVMLHPTPHAWASSRAIYIMVSDRTWLEPASHCERLASTPFLW